MTPDGLPEGIITRFRTLSLERVGKVEATWNSILAGVVEPSALRDLMRELHTLKGDSRIVGFDEIHTLSHKLEELIALATQLDYRMSEDLELVITMAIQFTNMLLRRKQASSTSGIDLPGFVRQVDEVLREARTIPLSTPRTTTITKPGTRETGLDRLSDPVRQRFAIAATGAFLEYLGARSTTSRHRLRGVWTMLRDELAALSAIPLAPLFERHVLASTRLATDLGKKIELTIDVADTVVDGRVAEAIDVALVHLIRNAIDHGIERADVRASRGKPAIGKVAVRACMRAGMIEVSVEDDGAGIDLASVKARVVERGFLKPERAARSTDAELFEYLFHSGFTTRQVVSETSGRGIGLDAVKAALTRAGGAVRINSEVGLGSTITLEVPATIRQLRAYQFLAPGGNLSFAVSARWDPTVETAPIADALDPMAVLQIPGSSRQTAQIQREAIRELGLRLRWGFLDVVLKAATQPQLVTVERICPTPDDYPIEVVLVDHRETILLRPEHVAATSASAAARA